MLNPIYASDPLNVKVLLNNQISEVGKTFLLLSFIIQIIFVPFLVIFTHKKKAKPEYFDAFAVLVPTAAMYLAQYLYTDSHPSWALLSKYINWFITCPVILSQFLRLLDADHLSSYVVFCDLNIKSAGFLGLFLVSPYNWIGFSYAFSLFQVLLRTLYLAYLKKTKELEKEPALHHEYKKLALVYGSSW